MTATKLVGAFALTTISVVAVMWYLRKSSKGQSGKRRKSDNASGQKDSKNNIRHVPSLPLIAETNTEPVSDTNENSNVKRIENEETVSKEGKKQFSPSKSENLLQKSNHCTEEKLSKSFKDKNFDSLNESDSLTRLPVKEDVMEVSTTNNLNKSVPIKDRIHDNKKDNPCQSLNLTSEVNETVASENVSVLNDAMTASRMEDVSFVNRFENESRLAYQNQDNIENESSLDGQNQEMEVQDDLSVSTMVPLLESTNLDITSSQQGSSNTDDVIQPENSIKLESAVHQPSQITSSKDKLSHTTTTDSVLQNNSDKRIRNDSNCSSQSANQMDDHISETSSDRTASPFKDRNSVSPSKDSQRIVENGVQNSDTSNCDSVSGDDYQVENGQATGPKVTGKISYKCNFPTEKCGRLIGKHGKNINFIKERTGANVALNTNPFTADFQLCGIEGTQRQIENALSMISKKFPDVDLSQVDVPSLNDPQPPSITNSLLIPEIMQLNLPEGVSVDVVVSSIVDAGHIFMQQPTHPSFPSLERLNQFMNACYNQDGIVPQLPRPLEVGVICAAPIMDGWYRAQVTAVYEGPDECDIKYVDYGGFSRVPGSVLRQIRSDFMTLPFQGIECYMANVTPLQDEEYFSSEAAAVLEELTQGKLLQAQVVGRNEDGVAYCHIYQINGDKVTFVNRELVNRGVVRWIEILS